MSRQKKTKTKNRTNYIMQGSILAAASILSRIIGMLYRLPVTNIITDHGNDYYSAAYEIYNIILLISSYSLPLAVSKLVSAKAALGQYRNAYRIFKGALYMALVVGLAGSAVTYLGAGFFTGSLLNTPESELSLKVLALAVFFLAVMGVLRGFFQGMGSMMPTAVSQVIEQIFNAVVSITAASLLFRYGVSLDEKAGIADGRSGPIYGAAGSTLGTSLGALSGLIFLIIVMLMYNRVLQRQMKRDRTGSRESYGTVFKLLVLTIVPVILSTAVYNISGVLDQGLFKYLMLDVQKMEKSVVEVYWGIYVGKYKLLTNVPIAVASALSASTIPALTRARMEGNRKEMRRKTDGAIRMVMFICIPSAFGLTALAEPILNLLSWNTDPIAPKLFWAGSMAVIFYGLSTLTNGILQGIDRMHIPVRNALISLALHLGLMVVLVQVFQLHIFGVVLSYLFFAVMMCILNGLAIRRHLRYRQELVRTFVIPVVSSTIMGLTCWLVSIPLEDLIGVRFTAVVCIILAVFIYGFFMLILRGITEQELAAFPKGHVLVRILKKMHLL
ncbi:MAG: polysaccharide biosynthesis protein [Lachnospiraceae bacterium]|uniref:putative polysaccharide biosynthesis protein n=1 Tax=Candidatus Merdisoma sp. JLR.KK011 TaxID=3114299 RepID=UPI0029DC540F|nr:polysaccharide biosynthesis protein [Lachnospiraceae bacterium]MCI9622134.1 polysaccharide biosynthesis protein [Lachnospiraceae bacterium]